MPDHQQAESNYLSSVSERGFVRTKPSNACPSDTTPESLGHRTGEKIPEDENCQGHIPHTHTITRHLLIVMSFVRYKYSETSSTPLFPFKNKFFLDFFKTWLTSAVYFVLFYKLGLLNYFISSTPICSRAPLITSCCWEAELCSNTKLPACESKFLNISKAKELDICTRNDQNRIQINSITQLALRERKPDQQ